MQFLLGFATDALQPMISVKNYVSFAGMLLRAFGIIVEFPLIIMFLTKIHMVTPQFLRDKRKHSILIIFILAAFITPPDMITQCLMAGPLIILYEISIWLSSAVYKSQNK